MSISDFDLEAGPMSGPLSTDDELSSLCRLLPTTEFNPITNLGLVTNPRLEAHAVGNVGADDDALDDGPQDDRRGLPQRAADLRREPVQLNRIREVRREQGVAIKRASQLLGRSVDELRVEEDPATDLTLTQLYEWHKLLEVPVEDLLVEPHAPLSAPVLQRARMVRLMKTVQAIMERSSQVSVRRLAQTMINQLVEIMPELEGVTPWHSVERRKTQNQNARILESNYLRGPEDERRSR